MKRILTILLVSIIPLSVSAKSRLKVEASGTTIPAWLRPAGNFTEVEKPKRHMPASYDLTKWKLKTKKMNDIQYGKKVSVRGVPLKELLLKYPHTNNVDTALLHFRNKMIIPVPLTRAALDKIDGFVALEMKVDGKWSKNLPIVPRSKEFYMDPRPLQFAGNKIVVATPYYPGVPDQTGKSFTPWRWADTLVGVEYVNKEAYDLQFKTTAKKDASMQVLARGHKAFLSRCLYCHSVRDVGARHGTDFVIGVPLAERKDAEAVFTQIKSHKLNAYEQGLQMPTQKDVEVLETWGLWAWMKVISKYEDLGDYTPPK